jgi:hypothetical protein
MHRFIHAVSGAALLIAAAETNGQTQSPVIVQGQPIPAIYDFHAVGSPGNELSISAVVFPSGNAVPPPIINAIQWTDPQQPPPNVAPPIFFYQVHSPLETINLPQLLIGNGFGAMGFIDGAIDLNQPPGMATFNVPPQSEPGAVPNDPIQRVGALGGPPQFQNTIAYFDPQPVPDGLRNTIVVGLALPGMITTPRAMVTYGDADPQTEPTDPNAPGGNGEFVWTLGPAMPDPCIDESLLTEETLDYLKEQEAANGVAISSETEVVNFQTVRDRVVGVTQADDGFTYVTVVEDFVTKAFYRFPTGSPDPKSFLPAQGDFEEDGDVDGNDLDLWAAHVGAMGSAVHTQGDADGDSDVDGADFLFWQRQLGIGVPLPPLAAVPEPTSSGLCLAACTAAGLTAGRARRRPTRR